MNAVMAEAPYSSSSSQPSRVGRADALQDLWSSMAMRHVALGGACACGSGGISLQLSDFELDITDYVLDAAARSGLGEVAGWAEQTLKTLADRGEVLRVPELLDRIAQGRMPEIASDWLLQRLERTLRSYAEQHGPQSTA